MIWILVTALTLAGLAGILLAPAMATKPGLKEHSTSFAAGVLITVILTHVVPESMTEEHRHGGAIILAGFIAMMLLQQKVLKADPCCGHEHAKHAGLPSYLAMVACSVNDALILHALPGPDETLFWAMCAHKITASFALVMLLGETSARLGTAMQMLYLAIFVAITPVVLLITHAVHLPHGLMHYPVALGAGALLYVVCGGMIPRVEHLAQDGRQRVLVTFLAGALITVLVEVVAPHHHGHAH